MQYILPLYSNVGAIKPLEVRQGADFQMDLFVRNLDGTPKDITGYSFAATMWLVADPEIVFQVSVLVLDAATGAMRISLTDDVTTTLTAVRESMLEDGRYAWAIDYELDGIRTPLFCGPVTVIAGNVVWPEGCVPPVIEAPPQFSVSGVGGVGGTISIIDGLYSGTDLQYTYNWIRWDGADVLTRVVIEDADAVLHTIVEDDVGQFIRVEFSVSNGCGTADLTLSSHSGYGPVGGYPPAGAPVQTVAGAISAPDGVADGDVLLADAGTWTGALPMTFAYQWSRWDGADEGTMELIANQVLNGYQLTPLDEGSYIRALVTATNVVDDTSEDLTGSMGPVTLTCVPPEYVAPATISAPDVEVGSMISVTAGEWSGTNLVQTIAWYRSDIDGSNPVQLAVPDDQFSYEITGDDVGHRVYARITSDNGCGTQEVAPAVTPLDGAEGFQIVSLCVPPLYAGGAFMTIVDSGFFDDGRADIGEQLSVVPGTWTGTDLVMTYAWFRWNGSDVESKEVIIGEVGTTYTLQAEDENLYVYAEVTATNECGSLTKQADIVANVLGLGPVGICVPPAYVSGEAIFIDEPPVVGIEAHLYPGSWTGTDLGYSYFWYRWDGVDEGTVELINEGGYSNYVLQAEDVGLYVFCTYTVVNGCGEDGPRRLDSPPAYGEAGKGVGPVTV